MSKLCKICTLRGKKKCYASNEDECNPVVEVNFDDVYDVDFNSYLETLLSNPND